MCPGHKVLLEFLRISTDVTETLQVRIKAVENKQKGKTTIYPVSKRCMWITITKDNNLLQVYGLKSVKYEFFLARSSVISRKY